MELLTHINKVQVAKFAKIYHFMLKTCDDLYFSPISSFF